MEGYRNRFVTQYTTHLNIWGSHSMNVSSLSTHDRLISIWISCRSWSAALYYIRWMAHQHNHKSGARSLATWGDSPGGGQWSKWGQQCGSQSARRWHSTLHTISPLMQEQVWHDDSTSPTCSPFWYTFPSRSHSEKITTLLWTHPNIVLSSIWHTPV